MQEVAGRVLWWDVGYVCVGEWDILIQNVCVYIRTKSSVLIIVFDLLLSFRSKQQGGGLARVLGPVC